MAKTNTDYKPAIERSITLQQYGLCFVRSDAEYNNLSIALNREHDIDQVYRQVVAPTNTHPGAILVLTLHKATNETLKTAIGNGGTIYRPDHHDRSKPL